MKSNNNLKLPKKVHVNHNRHLDDLTMLAPKLYALPTKPFNVAKLQFILSDCEEREKKVKIQIENQKNEMKTTINDQMKQKLKQVKTQMDQMQKLDDVQSSFQLSNNNLEELNSTLLSIYDPIIQYVDKYYYEVAKGEYYYYDVLKEDFVHKTQKDFIAEVCNKIFDKSFQQLFMKNKKIYNLVCKILKPKVYSEFDDESKEIIYYLNTSKGFLHKNWKTYDQYNLEIKNKVNMILDMIKEISCNNDQNVFEAYVKYLSQVCQGKRTEVIIYKKSGEGTGKTTESEFMMEHVLGPDLVLISNTEPLLKDFNMILLGKILVVFEDLPSFGSSQFEIINNKLKTLTTDKRTTFRGLYKEPIQEVNMNNYMIHTNQPALKEVGRRIIELTINTSRIGDVKYFENVRKECFNLEVGEAFFSYMMSIDNTNFYGQRDFPVTENALLSKVNQLHPVKKFLKFEYILKNKSVEKVKPKDLHDEYCLYCNKNQTKFLKKDYFIKALDEMNIKPTKISTYYYNVSLTVLKALAEKERWLHEYDEVEEDDDEDAEDIDTEQLCSVASVTEGAQTVINEESKDIQIQRLKADKRMLIEILKAHNIQYNL